MEHPADPGGQMPGVPLVGTYSGRLLLAFVIYIAWMAETLLLGNGISHAPAAGPRDWVVPVIVVGIFIGCIVSSLFLKTSMARGMVSPGQAGLDPGKKTIPALIITGISGGIALAVVPFLNIIVPDPFRTFLFLFPLAAGEVMICWALLATHIESALLLARGGPAALAGFLAAALASSFPYLSGALLSGGYTFSLLVIFAGLITGFVFLAFRDIYATLLARLILLMILAGVSGMTAWEGIPLLYSIPLAIVAGGILLVAGAALSRKFGDMQQAP
ncbi:MAG: hypothetical protein ABFC24_01400 [Methanoregulaceae archaeon]